MKGLESDTPELSVLIATRNRMSLLEKTLSHLQRQYLHGIRWEVVVVDNGSTDDTPSVLARARKNLPLIDITEPSAGKNRALNKALAFARGGLLVFTDDDIEFSPGWLGEIYAAAQRWPEHEIFCGPIIPAYPAETPSWLRDHPYAGPAFAQFQPEVPEGPLPNNRLPFGGNYAVRAAAMSGLRFCLKFCPKLGSQGNGFPIGDETEMLSRLSEQGARIIYVPTAAVRHHVGKHQIETKWLFNRAFCIGRGTARLKARRAPSPAVKTWVQILTSGAQHALSALGNQRRWFETGAQFHYLRGIRHEQRVMAGESEDVPLH
jgi:glycosyltransferase involved in cell wall biosynthesis